MFILHQALIIEVPSLNVLPAFHENLGNVVLSAVHQVHHTLEKSTHLFMVHALAIKRDNPGSRKQKQTPAHHITQDGHKSGCHMPISLVFMPHVHMVNAILVCKNYAILQIRPPICSVQIFALNDVLIQNVPLGHIKVLRPCVLEVVIDHTSEGMKASVSK